MKKIESNHFVNHLYIKKQMSRKKTIMIFHGWGSSVHNYKRPAENLSTLGFKIIVPEIIFHDSRSKFENHFLKEVTQKYFWKTIFRSIDEASLLFEELGILKEDTILMGISMGGFIANGIYANGQNFAGLVNINGSGSFLLSEKIFRQNDHRPRLSIAETKEINIYNPIDKIACPSPILLMHGEQDTIVSIEGQKDYFNFLTESDTVHDVIFNIYKNVNHSFSEEMMENLKQWLVKKF
ncbi:dienelactone hydrolase family protein [Psychrobacillus sp. INOP01]|uniref:alpha/beta hydrolase n=1 Tax=Psychrobacillus sp. INOP01 TaxID=2829187 RepID=UPI001BA63025|nr:dienelactone hydrolase family protein [Psychrobacillus sp. INOP01]QUG43597.1 dienelactone hydrolase family protein [Psychrobacillus sp. INOP01]